VFKKLYFEQLSKEEIKEIIKSKAKQHKDYIEKQVEKKASN
jgi:hypothetical protein